MGLRCCCLSGGEEGDCGGFGKRRWRRNGGESGRDTMELILAMAHPDPEIRVRGHRIFSVVLMPSLDCSWSDPNRKASIALLEFYSSATASQKSRRNIFVYSGGECQTDVMDEGMNEERNQNMDMGVLNNIVCPFHSFEFSSPYVVVDGKKEVVNDMKLQAAYIISDSEKTISCSKEDEVMASKSLSEVEVDDKKL
ncbi:hypothetical protein GIB67_041876 [Kingdonia uniflora]|uniref:Uncharacterized protein n=1 Tax=Kingdonia uniflora TaxID=39325 RepID=A0A7J7L5Y9_9MAGN|nr:hypothetical protein GIB67_041876 [Kingdonia uniflora]